MNKETRRLLFEAMRNLPVPSMGEFAPWSGNGPAFSTLRDKVSWQFVRCQLCGDDATERSLVVLVQEARNATILTCKQCDQKMHAERVATRGGFLTGKSFVLLGRNTALAGNDFDVSCAETLRRNIDSVRTKVVRIARQNWTTSPIGPRAARRSTPFPDLGRRASAPLPVSRCKARVIKSVEIAVVVAIPGSSATQVFHLCIAEPTAKTLVEAPSSTDRIKLMLSSALNLRQHRTLLHYMSTAVESPLTSDPRKNATPLKTPPTVCTHAYGAFRPNIQLLRCSGCNGRDA